MQQTKPDPIKAAQQPQQQTAPTPTPPASNGLGPFGSHCSNRACPSPRQCSKQGQCRYAP